MTPFLILGGGLLAAILAGRKRAAPPQVPLHDHVAAPGQSPASPACGCSHAMSQSAPPASPAKYFAASSTALGAAVGVAPGQTPSSIVRIA